MHLHKPVNCEFLPFASDDCISTHSVIFHHHKMQGNHLHTLSLDCTEVDLLAHKLYWQPVLRQTKFGVTKSKDQPGS